MFYKVIYDHIVIDVLSNPKWVIWAKKSCRFLETDITSANGVISSDGSCTYNLEGKDKFENYHSNYKTVVVIEISEGEYYNLLSQIVDKTVSDKNEPLTIEDVANAKIAELSSECEQVIVNGFDIILSDNIKHHFSLTIQDQLNLITLSNLAAEGNDYIPYHADGELCRYYTAAEILNIITAATNFKTYHVTYFNSLKSYIKSMTSIKDISNVYYGTQIPEDFQSDILKVLMQQVSEGV